MKTINSFFDELEKISMGRNIPLLKNVLIQARLRGKDAQSQRVFKHYVRQIVKGVRRVA